MIDVLIVGGGPGGIGAAYAARAANPALRVTLVEAGRPYERRFCPVDLAKRCRGCGGICNVISGFGGSMHYGDGIKLSLLPSGRRLVDLMGTPDSDRLCAASFQLLTGQLPAPPALVGNDVAAGVLATFADYDLQLRQYPVAVLGESDLKQVIAGIYEDLAQDIDIRLETDVVEVRPDDDGYRVTVRTRGRDVTESQLHARAVILATGRRGIASTQRTLRQLGVPMYPPSFSCGVRFEMQADHLRATGISHPDMKVTQRDVLARKVKTFCFCGGVNGGRVKFTHYQGAFGDPPLITLDGHETLERVTTDRPVAGNFGLMCQARELEADADRSPYLQKVLLEPYRQLNGGRPVVQTFAEFCARRAPAQAWDDLAASLPFEPSVRDLATAPLHSLFTDDEHASLVEGFDNVMRPMLKLGGSAAKVGDLAGEILVIGLELEFLWSHVAVDDTAETPLRNLFVVGDAAGIAQGVIQAMMMGMRAGETVGGRFAGVTSPSVSPALAACRTPSVPPDGERR
jgi:uncharacterized FAD-dependent dehydrogenase